FLSTAEVIPHKTRAACSPRASLLADPADGGRTYTIRAEWSPFGDLTAPYLKDAVNGDAPHSLPISLPRTTRRGLPRGPHLSPAGVPAGGAFTAVQYI